MYGGDRLLSSVYGGIVVGVGMALIFQAGFTTGGTDIAGYLLQKKFPHYSIGHALMIIEGIILLMSIFVFQDVDAGLFGLISVYVQTKVIDMILYGSDAGSQAVIITQYPQEISQRVIQELERTTTVLPARGAYSGSPTNVVLCTVRKSEFVRLKRIIGQCDPNAFVMVNETTGVGGAGTGLQGLCGGHLIRPGPAEKDIFEDSLWGGLERTERRTGRLIFPSGAFLHPRGGPLGESERREPPLTISIFTYILHKFDRERSAGRSPLCYTVIIDCCAPEKNFRAPPRISSGGSVFFCWRGMEG